MLSVLHASNLDRRSYVVVIGGGAILDAVRFAVAIAYRGLRLVRLPTTTLAQSDSGVGVENAMNLFKKKNWIGIFAVPWAVINDATLLKHSNSAILFLDFRKQLKLLFSRNARFLNRFAIKLPVCDNATWTLPRT